MDDDAAFCTTLSRLLEGRGYKVAAYDTAGRFLDSLLRERPSLLVLDVGIPGMNGFELVRVLRRNPNTRQLPVIMVSDTKAPSSDVVQGFNDGADEFFAKPFAADLFLARVQALLRRSVGGAETPAEMLTAGPIRMNLEDRSVLNNSSGPVSLTRLEFDLLEYFMRHPNRVLTRSILLQAVWKNPPDLTTRTVDKHVESLRKKIGSFGRSLKTVVSVGYVFKPEENGG